MEILHRENNSIFEKNSSPQRNRVEGIRPYPNDNNYVLKLGETSELVFILQLMLNSLSIYYNSPRIPVSGIFDTTLQKIVAEFQRINMIPVSGTVDRTTWQRLVEEYNETVNDRQ